LEDEELPLGVADGVADSLKLAAREVCHYGVIGSRTPFWDWMTGREFVHVWSIEGTAGLQSIDGYGPVDAVFFEYAFPRIGHVVWTTPGLKLVV
jgi:hypothetical protein